MALPKLNTPEYELELPSTGGKIKYRPFLVKEQKLLMMAQESENDDQISNTIISIRYFVVHLFLQLVATVKI